jgi:hypothetical protein
MTLEARLRRMWKEAVIIILRVSRHLFGDKGKVVPVL